MLKQKSKLIKEKFVLNYQGDEMYQYDEPQYYQDYPYEQSEAKTFQPIIYSSKEYQNLLKRAKPMFTAVKK